MPNASSSVTGSPVAASRRSWSWRSGVNLGGLVAGSFAARQSAARGSRPSSSSSSARVAMIAATARPVGWRCRCLRGWRATKFAAHQGQRWCGSPPRPNARRSIAETITGVAFAGVVEQRGPGGSMGAGSSGEGVGEDRAGSTPAACRASRWMSRSWPPVLTARSPTSPSYRPPSHQLPTARSGTRRGRQTRQRDLR